VSAISRMFLIMAFFVAHTDQLTNDVLKTWTRPAGLFQCLTARYHRPFGRFYSMKSFPDVTSFVVLIVASLLSKLNT